MAEVDTTPPPAEETPPVEEQAPVTEEKEEKPKKSMFSSFCGCFGSKSAVVEGEKPEAEDSKEDTEAEKPAEEKPEDAEVAA
mmetsp:Transcript_16749/g.38407  ORF Transcript_16749/g.38407 Transcript_16749/m.38407 type:complete len:82 (-) Transcript_16749:144-389(-)